MAGPGMSMNKAIHVAVRRDLDRFARALEAFPVGDQRRADGLWTAWTNFEHQLHEHHTGEHDAVWPALRRIGVDERLIATMDGEHDAMSQAVTTAGEALSALVHSPGEPQARHAHAAFVRLREVTVAHLDHEEAELEPVMQSHRNHPAVVEMTKTLRRRVGMAEGGRFFAWMLDGATPEQRATVDRAVPAPVLKVMTGVFGRSYRRHVAPVWSR